eukprot:1424318-Rhodomonas_salina.1
MIPTKPTSLRPSTQGSLAGVKEASRHMHATGIIEGRLGGKIRSNQMERENTHFQRELYCKRDVSV